MSKKENTTHTTPTTTHGRTTKEFREEERNGESGTREAKGEEASRAETSRDRAHETIFFCVVVVVFRAWNDDDARR